jgi:hypothetical protein
MEKSARVDGANEKSPSHNWCLFWWCVYTIFGKQCSRRGSLDGAKPLLCFNTHFIVEPAGCRFLARGDEFLSFVNKLSFVGVC